MNLNIQSLLLCVVMGVNIAHAVDSSSQHLTKSTEYRELLRHTVQPALTAKGMLVENILLGSTGLPTGTQVRSECIVTWSGDPVHRWGCQKKNPNYDRPVQYVPPQGAHSLDHTPDGDLVLHRWSEMSVLGTASGVFLMETRESARIAPDNTVRSVGHSRSITAQHTQGVVWAEFLRIATGRISETVLRAVQQIQRLPDGKLLITTAPTGTSLRWQLWVAPEDHWLIRRAEAQDAHGTTLFTVETLGTLRDEQSGLVIAAKAQISSAPLKISVQYTECSPKADLALLNALHLATSDKSATVSDCRTGDTGSKCDAMQTRPIEHPLRQRCCADCKE
ncbi:MAG: hypothetical protein ACK4P5_04325 [Fimbriimonadales bacterium]